MTITPQVIQIVIAFISIVFFLFPLGFIVKYYWPTLPWRLIPVFGLIIYGGVAVPILYFVGKFSFIILDIIVALLVMIGLVFAILYIRKKPKFFFHWQEVLLTILLVLLASVIIASLSQQPVPGGVDSAMHSQFMTIIEVSGNFDVKYPLGLHTIILFFENILDINRAYIMQAFAAFLSVNFFALIYSLLKQISKKNIIGWLGIIAVILDASFYNNLLNGSLTHILAINLILCYLLYLESLKKADTRATTFILLILSISIVYFHFITWYFILPALWFQRLILQRNKLKDLLTTIGILLVSIPLIFRLYDFLGYAEVFRWTTVLIIGFELLLFFCGKCIFRLFHKQWLYFILGGLAIFLFISYHNNIFDNMDQWYGWSITGLAIIGLGYTSIKRQWNLLPYLLLFSVYTVIFALFAFSWANPITSKISLVKELFFYYGFTVPLVIFAAIGLYCFVILGASRRVQALKITVFLIVAILVFTSRMSDKILIGNKNAISRYNNNSGFGMFFQKNDVLLADWFREHTDDALVVANPGGLYGIWTSMAGHPTVYFGYGQINVPHPIETNQEIINLMTNGESGRPAASLSNNVGYLFVPQAVPADIAHPYLKLLKQFGTARLYKILDQPETIDRLITLYPLLNDSIADIHLTGDYVGQAPLNGNRFFYQFQQVVQKITLESEKTIQLLIDKSTMRRTLVLKLHTNSEGMRIRVNGVQADIQRGQAGEIYAQKELVAAEDAVITLQNTSETPAIISNIIVQLAE